MDVHVLFGGSVERERLPQFAASGGKAVWTLTKEAKAGDTVVFYIKSPLASFVATGRVVDGRRESGDEHGFPDQPMGDVHSVEPPSLPCATSARCDRQLRCELFTSDIEPTAPLSPLSPPATVLPDRAHPTRETRAVDVRRVC